MESLRVTLSSVLDIIRFLLLKGAHYVLTGKLNQDPLEVSRKDGTWDMNFFVTNFIVQYVNIVIMFAFLLSEVFRNVKELWGR